MLHGTSVERAAEALARTRGRRRAEEQELGDVFLRVAEVREAPTEGNRVAGFVPGPQGRDALVAKALVGEVNGSRARWPGPRVSFRGRTRYARVSWPAGDARARGCLGPRAGVSPPRVGPNHVESKGTQGRWLGRIYLGWTRE